MYGREVVVRLPPLPKKKSEPGSLRTRLQLDDDTLVIGHCGRIHPEKGIQCFAKVAASILAERPDIHAVLMGEGPGMEWLRKFCETLKEQVSSRIHILGFVEDPIAQLSGIDVVILPSHRESLGLVAVEAAIMSRAIVCSDIDPWSSIFAEDGSAKLVPADDVEGFIEATYSFLDSPEQRRDSGESSRKAVHRYYKDHAGTLSFVAGL